MNTREWARRTHQRLGQDVTRRRALTQAEVEAALRAALEVLAEALISGEELRSEALGRLWAEEAPGRQVRSGLDGALRQVPARRRLKVRAASGLAAKLSETGT